MQKDFSDPGRSMFSSSFDCLPLLDDHVYHTRFQRKLSLNPPKKRHYQKEHLTNDEKQNLYKTVLSVTIIIHTT